MHVRQLAWLAATPEKATKSRYKSFSELDENSTYLKLPKIDGAEYLVSLLYEAGLLESSGMGAMPLSWQEIESYLTCTRTDLTTWETLMLKTLSEAYVGEYNQASKKDRSAPYFETDIDVKANRENVSKKMLSVFRSFKKPDPNAAEVIEED